MIECVAYWVERKIAAQLGHVPTALWWLYAANLLWTVAYDTQYAMVDREDDVKIGVKSTAILFGRYDRLVVAGLQAASLACLYVAGQAFQLGSFYTLSLLLAAALFLYHQFLIRTREPTHCFKAFLHNSWVGATVFGGIALHYFLTAQ